MTSPSPNRQNPLTSERNNKIASILCLVITFFEKIEKIKEKLCGFSPKQFSPESIFEALDLTEKGYLDMYDVHSFLANEKIRDRDVLLLFSRLGDSGVGRMTYLGYLSMLKPYFDHELARDLLLRDTVAHRKERDMINNQENIQEMQQTVLILLNELFLLHCICIQEHEELKTALIEEYMLNQEELRQILGLGGRVPGLTAIYEFICCSCEFQIEKSEVKYLLSFLQTNQPSLAQQKSINLLFLPSRPLSKKVKHARKEEDNILLKNRQELHSNYNKCYLGRNDLISTTNKISFLNYIHPNSYNTPIQQSNYLKKPGKQQKYSSESTDMINTEHKRLKVSQDRIMNKAHKQQNPRSIIPQQSQLSESIVQKSNFIHQKPPQDSRLNQPSFQRLQTPILEQFMHDSNLKKNMGYYRSSQQQGLQLKQVLEQSNLSSSDAMIRVDRTSKQAFRPKQYNQYNYKEDSRNQSMEHSKYINNSYLQSSKLNQAHKISQQQRPDSTSGFLGQFIRSEFR